MMDDDTPKKPEPPKIVSINKNAHRPPREYATTDDLEFLIDRISAMDDEIVELKRIVGKLVRILASRK